MFIVVIEMKTFALFQCGGKPAALRAAAYGDGQAGFQGAQHGNEAGAHPITSSDVFDEVFLAGLAGTQEMVRPSSSGGGLLSRLAHPFSEGLRVGGEVHQADFRGAQIGAHPLGRKQRPEAGVESEPIPTTERALDQRAELVHKALGNEVFGQKWFLHKHSSTTRRPRSQPSIRPERRRRPDTYSAARPSRNQHRKADRKEATLVAAWPRCAVSQVFNLPHAACEQRSADYKSAIRQIKNLRYGKQIPGGTTALPF